MLVKERFTGKRAKIAEFALAASLISSGFSPASAESEDLGNNIDIANYPTDKTLTIYESTSSSAATAVNITVLAAGDIASNGVGDTQTAKLLKKFPGATVITLGDNVYPTGSYADFMKYYNPTWGQAKTRTKPTIGNHEYVTENASGYFRYFGKAAGNPDKGYYSFNLSKSWHVVVLNSNCGEINGGCAAGSPEESWLRQDLQNNPRKCTLAVWHHPLFTSGGTNNTSMKTMWQDLYDANAELVLSGHVHNYERFAPQTAEGKLDTAKGITEIVVGTGGDSHMSFKKIMHNSKARNATTYGVLKLTLRSSSYTSTFLPIAGKTFTDTKTTNCH